MNQEKHDDLVNRLRALSRAPGLTLDQVEALWSAAEQLQVYRDLMKTVYREGCNGETSVWTAEVALGLNKR